MSIVHVAGGGFTAGAGTATVAITVVAGENVIVGCAGAAAFGTADFASAGGVSDSVVGNYTRRVISPAPSGWVSAIFEYPNHPGGSLTITITNASASSPQTWGAYARVTGLAASSAFDVGASGNGTGSAKATGNLSGTTAQNDEYEFAFLQDHNAFSAAITVDAFSPTYTQIVERIAGTDIDGEADYRILSATTNVGCTWVGSGFEWSACAATFKAAAGGGGGVLVDQKLGGHRPRPFGPGGDKRTSFMMAQLRGQRPGDIYGPIPPTPPFVVDRPRGDQRIFPFLPGSEQSRRS